MVAFADRFEPARPAAGGKQTAGAARQRNAPHDGIFEGLGRYQQHGNDERHAASRARSGSGAATGRARYHAAAKKGGGKMKSLATAFLLALLAIAAIHSPLHAQDSAASNSADRER